MDLQHDLLGLPITDAEAMAKPKRPKKTGHAAPPGSGPLGETCAGCKHYARIQRANVYRKCALMQKHWTAGPGSDIKAKDAACRHWEKQVDD